MAPDGGSQAPVDRAAGDTRGASWGVASSGPSLPPPVLRTCRVTRCSPWRPRHVSTWAHTPTVGRTDQVLARLTIEKMWPWDHVAVAYVLYSLLRRLGGERPSSEVFVLGGAAILPDVVDKTLSWGLGAFPSGYAVGHSLFVAVPLGTLVAVLSARRQRLDVGLAFVVGYWSHLAGDVAWGALVYGEPAFDRILWPLVEFEPYPTRRGLLDRALYYLGELAATLGDAEPAVVAAYLAPVAASVALWLLDGAPGIPRPSPAEVE